MSSSKSSFSIACFLSSHGTDLTLRNNEDQTPLDLCLDPSLSEAISKWHVPRTRLADIFFHYYVSFPEFVA